MLSSSRRLNSRQFTQVFTKGSRAHTQHFSLSYSDADSPRFAVAVGKKYSAKRVVRNRLRRQVFAALREIAQEEGLPSLWVVVVCKKNTSSQPLTYQEIKDELAFVLHKITTG